jgi:hypothetical protein
VGNAPDPLLFFLTCWTGEGDKHVSGPRLSLLSSESHPLRSNSPGRASSSGRMTQLYGPMSEPLCPTRETDFGAVIKPGCSLGKWTKRSVL